MKTALLLLLAAALAPAQTKLTTADLTGALEFAHGVWNAEPDGVIELRLVPLNACGLDKHDLIAQTGVSWSETAIHFDSELPAEDAPAAPQEAPQRIKARRYIISVNSNCDWSKLNLDNVMLHEYGHVLLGVEAAWHSKNPKSIMFWIVSGKQTILADDRAKLKGLVASK